VTCSASRHLSDMVVVSNARMQGGPRDYGETFSLQSVPPSDQGCSAQSPPWLGLAELSCSCSRVLRLFISPSIVYAKLEGEVSPRFVRCVCSWHLAGIAYTKEMRLFEFWRVVLSLADRQHHGYTNSFFVHAQSLAEDKRWCQHCSCAGLRGPTASPCT